MDYFFKHCKNLDCLKNRSVLPLESMSNFYFDAISRFVSKNKSTEEDIKSSIIDLGNKLIQNCNTSTGRILEFSK